MMEKGSPVKLSVAELAGKFKGHPIPRPTAQDEAPKVLTSKCPLLIGRLQANLALSPTCLLTLPKSPRGNLPSVTFCPISPCSSQSPTRSNEEEEPITFDMPAEGTPLLSFNKSRARLSFKRRPPTRQHRQSCGEEGVVSRGGCVSPAETDGPQENGVEDRAFLNPGERLEGGEGPQGYLLPPSATLTDNRGNSEEAEPDKAPGTTEEMGEVAPIDQHEEEAAGEQTLGGSLASDSLEAMEEEGSCIRTEEPDIPPSENEQL
ncbi:hypothetical protein DPEC_G00297570 [Dallia pectoralis]|uniref:Uncharacterized protein n=1 Tax=Dallia pectoralis TaxID=75939 RepID=A0ACC2FFK0_DALPE|nr:hypothetical protein DPEC_G00297570 [Dallia pectoralis]